MTYFNLAVLWSALAICKSDTSSHTTFQRCRQETRERAAFGGSQTISLAHNCVKCMCGVHYGGLRGKWL